MITREGDECTCTCGLRWGVDEEDPHAPVMIGVDLAKPGADRTVLWPDQDVGYLNITTDGVKKSFNKYGEAEYRNQYLCTFDNEKPLSEAEYRKLYPSRREIAQQSIKNLREVLK